MLSSKKRTICFNVPRLGTFRRIGVQNLGSNVAIKIQSLPKTHRTPIRNFYRDTICARDRSSEETRAYPDYKNSLRFRPKQSLGQNFLRDQRIATRIVDTFVTSVSEICPDAGVVEIGPGTGALTSMLLESFPRMKAFELDQRAVAMLKDTLPDLDVERADVLGIDWAKLAKNHCGSLAVIGNLPYNIVSQILFALLEAPPPSVRMAVVMMQREVAERVVARPRTKAYGILSVVGQLYSKPLIMFPVPSTAFRPIPSVESAIVRLEFIADKELDVYNTALTSGLRSVVRASFQQRRKTLRNSLKVLCESQGKELPDKWSSKRAEELPPSEFIDLTRYIYSTEVHALGSVESDVRTVHPVWRSVPAPT